MLVDQAAASPYGASSFLLKAPARVIRTDHAWSVGDALHSLDDARREALVAGWLSYELGYALEPALSPGSTGVPLIDVGIYPESVPVAPAPCPAWAGDEEHSLKLWDFRFDMEKEEHGRNVRTILEKIRDGEVYQVNFTVRLFFRFSGDPRKLYRRLRQAQPVPNSFLLKNKGEWILSLSPELFFHRQSDKITVQPMKGTLSRGRTLQEDRDRTQMLAGDLKNRAENLMIVDLMRNDLGRIARFGSVEVCRLFEVKPYPTLLQMVSTVSANMREGAGVPDLLRALFPSGSVTGAPKVAAMKLIRELESGPRGVYCGAVGWMAGNQATFNVGIRTIHLHRLDASNPEPQGEYAGVLGIGSGIVADSDPESEWEETLLKSRYVTTPPPSFCLLESLRFESGFSFLEAHLYRLSQSAEYFGFPYDRPKIERALRAHCSRLGSGPFKVRLLLDPAGEIRVSSQPVSRPEEPVKVCLAQQATDPDNVFLYHKSTRRGLYEAAQQAARRLGYWDLIFCNSQGFVTEGSISNVFVLHQGRWLTPSLQCGLLPGVAREATIARLGAEERAFTPETLLQAEKVLVTNAVHGPLHARVSPDRVRIRQPSPWFRGARPNPTDPTGFC